MRAAEGEGEEERRTRPRRREAAEAAADEVAEDEEDNSLLLRGRLIRGRMGLEKKDQIYQDILLVHTKSIEKN